MLKINLTPEDILRADTYIPLLKKEAFVQTAYVNCLDRVELAIQEGDSRVPVPPIYKDNVSKKSRYMMGALVGLYLKKPYDPTEDAYLMAADDYDRWAGSHIFNQLERLKAVGGEVRERVFDILTDYRDFERRLNVEVYNMVQLQNDICTRLYAMILQQSTPEEMQKRMKELEAVKKELDTYLAAKKGQKG